MTIEQDDLHYHFCLEVLRLLHIHKEEFFRGLAANQRYETRIYIWITRMFRKEKSKEETVQFIYRARRRCYFNAIYPINDA